MLGEHYAVNPAHLIGQGERDTVALFYAAELGSGCLPQAGGLLDQAALMMDAFEHCRAVRARIRAEAEILDPQQQLGMLIMSALRAG